MLRGRQRWRPRRLLARLRDICQWLGWGQKLLRLSLLGKDLPGCRIFDGNAGDLSVLVRISG
jgi:hypothetical protein